MNSPVMLDDNSRLCILHPEQYAKSKLVQTTCNEFRTKLLQFNDLVKQLLSQVNEQAEKIEVAKVHAIGTRNLVSDEVETRAKKLREQNSLIADKQEQLERLKTELKSLVMVKQEQEAMIARLSESTMPT
ncbi:unnamed protein product [Calypogeia fissa]